MCTFTIGGRGGVFWIRSGLRLGVEGGGRMEKTVAFWILLVEGNCPFLICGLNHTFQRGFPAEISDDFVSLGININRKPFFGKPWT